jgi:AcrR family transcriptional regulator
MVRQSEPIAAARIPLSKDRVLRGAITVADAGGIEALTMRKLAEELGVEAMSLYYHVANKEALLDGMADAIVGEIEQAVGGFDVPSNGVDWKAAIRRRILAAREVMLRHPWAPGVIETRTTVSPAMMRYFDSLIGVFRAGGFSYDLAHHALHALGSRAIGFSQELGEPHDGEQADQDVTVMLEQMADQLPYIVGMLQAISHDDPDSTLGWCDDQVEFEFALDLILDGLERLRNKA